MHSASKQQDEDAVFSAKRTQHRDWLAPAIFRACGWFVHYA